MSKKPRKDKKMNHKAAFTRLASLELSRLAFVMTPTLGHVMAVNRAKPKQEPVISNATRATYLNLNMNWNVVTFALIKDAFTGDLEIEETHHGVVVGRYHQVATHAFDLTQKSMDKLNKRRRINGGFALTLAPVTVKDGDIDRWLEIDPEFAEAAGVITERDERMERARLISALEKVSA